MRRGDERDKKGTWRKKAGKGKNYRIHETYIKNNGGGTILICILIPL